MNLLIALLLAITEVVAAPTLAISPTIALVPLDYLRITAKIPRDAEARYYCVTAVLDEAVVRRSCEQLEGENAAITNQFYWRSFRESGTYTITLTVSYATGRRYTVSTPLILKGGLNDPGDRTP
jgi:hypothetical protein